jgi:hypothetical protein
MIRKEKNQSEKTSILSTTAVLTLSNRIDHFLARWGYKRNAHRVEPGLYCLGSPDADSRVFVTANYTLSFDALRSSLKGIDAYILVLDTKGINVWCAAGKGTFGTDELVNRINTTNLSNVVNQRNIIVPQLGAPGISAHEVKKRSGFKVEYGPVRAEDNPLYLETHEATAEMRRVHFTFKDRFILVPVEFVSLIIPMLIAGMAAFMIGGVLPALAVCSAIFSAAVLFPILLPWIPTPNFSTKGFILGGFISFIFALISFFGNADTAIWQRVGWALGYFLILPPISAFITLNFTGATTFTSRSGVKREIFKYIPVMAWVFGSGLILSLTVTLLSWLGGVR